MKKTYCTYHSFKDSEGNSHSMASQLYAVGIYIIFDNNPALQGGSTPQKIIKLQNKLRADEKAGLISELSFGGEITVTDDSGTWERVREVEDIVPEPINLKVGGTYVCPRSGKRREYLFTVCKLDDDNVEFSVSPLCKLLDSLKIGDNLYKSDIGTFRASVTV